MSTTAPITATPVRDIPLAPSRYNPVHPSHAERPPGRYVHPASMHDFDVHTSPWIAAIDNTRDGPYARYSIHYHGRHSVSRRVQNGPLLAGPYAFLVCQGTVIDNHGGTGAEAARNRAAGAEFDAEIGDVWTLAGELWQVRLHRWDGPYLALLYPEQGPRPAAG